MKENKLLESCCNAWSDDSLRLFSQVSEYVKNSYFYVQETGFFKTDKNYFVERENLPSYLVLYCLNGSGTLNFRGQEYVIDKNKAFWIDCEELHQYKNKDTSWEFLWIHFYGNGIKKYYNQFEENQCPVIDFAGNEQIPRLINSIIYNQQHLNSSTPIMNSYHITGIMTYFLMSTNLREENPSYMPDFIKKVKRDLERRFFEPITLESLAKTFSMDKFYLSKEFKKWIGFSPIDYVIKLRLSSAKELLKSSQLTVGEIADKVGINNVGHFINLFKKYEGMTPLKFRKLWR